MADLSKMKCVTARKGEPTLTETQIYQFMPQISDWQVTEVHGEKRLERAFKFKNFAEALAFTDRVGAIAEQEDHHPLLITEWGKVTVNWWTHVIHGLHQNDFVMAAKTDQVLQQRSA